MNNLPKGWELKYIEDIAEVKGGKRLPKGSFLSEDITPYPYIRVTNMYMGGIDFSDILYVPEDIQPQIKNYTISKNDLFISVAGTLGIVGEVPEELDNANLTENADKLTNIKINKKFLLYVLMSNLIQNEIKNQTTSNAQPKLALSRIKQFQIPVPPLEEQKKIADILSTVDKKIAFVEENINATEELKKGLMQKLLTEGIGHTEFKNSELGRIPESWEIDKLENLTTKIGDGLHGTPKYVEQSDYYFINGNNLNGESIEINKNTKCVNEEEYIKNKKILDNTTILLSINGTIGSLAYYNNENVMLGKSVAYMNVNSKILKQFLFYLLKSSKVLEYFILELTGTTIKNLSLKTIRNTKIPLPPFEEQKQIAEILSTVDNKLENLKEKKLFFEELKKGLMQKLLTGEVRV